MVYFLGKFRINLQQQQLAAFRELLVVLFQVNASFDTKLGLKGTQHLFFVKWCLEQTDEMHIVDPQAWANATVSGGVVKQVFLLWAWKLRVIIGFPFWKGGAC